MSSKDIYEVMKGLTRDGNLPALDYTPVDVGVKGQRFTWYLHSDLNGCREIVAVSKRAVRTLQCIVSCSMGLALAGYPSVCRRGLLSADRPAPSEHCATLK
jgi:hypothetical protein